MQYDKKDLIQKVIDEATKLREHATKDELGELDFNLLQPNDVGYCIYGQMAGNCYSLRASELLSMCCAPFSSAITKFDTPILEKYSPLSIFRFGANSPIEFYIAQPGAKNETLIEFLKSERETLTPQDLEF